MTKGQMTVRCPECDEPITLPLRLTDQRAANPPIAVDLAPVQTHVATHGARFATDLPPTVTA